MKTLIQKLQIYPDNTANITSIKSTGESTNTKAVNIEKDVKQGYKQTAAGLNVPGLAPKGLPSEIQPT